MTLPDKRLESPNEESNDTWNDQLCFLRTAESFRLLEQRSTESSVEWFRNLEKLSAHHKRLLGKDPFILPGRFAKAIAKNASFYNHVLSASHTLYDSYWGTQSQDLHRPSPLIPSVLDLDKAASTLRQFVRDWSLEGEVERSQCYGPLLNKLCELFPDVPQRSSIHILFPGAGLSRLSFEASLLGFYSQGNEFSYHMLIAGHYVLNYSMIAEQHSIYPYIGASTNHLSRDDQFREIRIPHRTTRDMITEREVAGHPVGSFSMCAGEFVEVYSKPDQLGMWNAVVTCFFVDTAHNVIEYVETIFNALRPGGSWINLGPLLYHFSGEKDEVSVELTHEEILEVARNVGFQVVSDELVNCTYTANVKSIRQTVYRSQFTCLKKPE